jgi:hypothetical protein
VSLWLLAPLTHDFMIIEIGCGMRSGMEFALGWPFLGWQVILRLWQGGFGPEVKDPPGKRASRALGRAGQAPGTVLAYARLADERDHKDWRGRYGCGGEEHDDGHGGLPLL